MRIKQEYTLQRILSEKCIHIDDKTCRPASWRVDGTHADTHVFYV
jgi:hypothetical protein